jgi:hypothetical protein
MLKVRDSPKLLVDKKKTICYSTHGIAGGSGNTNNFLAYNLINDCLTLFKGY